MRCAECQQENREGRKFCASCGAPLSTPCPACGAANEPGEKFCGECGAAIATRPAAAPAAAARKVVTIVFADLAGSTALHERLDPESVTRFMESYYGAMRRAVAAHGGTVVKLLGDGVMAAFGVPTVAEDDAIRAVRAAVAMQQAFRDLVHNVGRAVPGPPGQESTADIGLRVALNTGEVVVSADNTDVVGDPVNVAARLQQEAHDGEVVIGESTRRLVGDLVTLAPLGSFALKGRAETVKAYRVDSLERPASAAAAAFVGRDDELARLTKVYDAAIAAPAARLAVVLGSPGLGKSRLIDELSRRVGDAAAVLTAHCDAAGGATFAPLADALRRFLGIDDSAGGDPLRAALEAAVPGEDTERHRIVAGISALLTGSSASPEETFFVVRRFLAALAAAKPVVLVIDDLHWAEPLLLDLVEHLVQWGSGVPLLVLVGARPELRDARSSLATPGGLVAEVVTLAGLDAGAAMRLAANVIGAADLPAAVAAKVLATSEGNPLFVAELVRMLVQEGALKLEGERWTTGIGLAALEMPPTIHALLAARIERLRPEERDVLERAAVVGRHFSRSAVAELLPRDVADLDARLESLRRSELIEPDTGWFLGEPALRFHHVLIRDAAYRRLLKETRAELHARFADWVEGRNPDAVEHDETIGWHLEQAHQHLRELGPLDGNGRLLGERAARRLAAAGRRALASDDVALAAGLLGRALERLDADDPARAELALDWCEALLAAGDVGPAAAAIEELARFAEAGVGAGEEADASSSTGPRPQTPDPREGAERRLRAWHTCFTGQLTALTAPQSLHATADAVAAAANELATLGDTAGEAKAHFVHAQTFARLGKIGACEAALDRALAAARKAGDRRRANTVLAVAPLAALWGPSPVTRASGRCLDVVRVLRITQGAPAVEAVALSCQGVLEALRGRTDAARRMIASARKMVEELGITQRLLEADVFAGRIELLEGDAIAAERCLRGAYEGLRDLGLGIDAARAAALLGRALLEQDRAAEAEALSRESEVLAGDDLQASIAWRGVRAEALARSGDHTAAVELAKAAVEIAAATDALLDHADARLALATALRAAGRNAEGDAEERRATELWATKGATLLAERRRVAERVSPVAAPAPAERAQPPPRRRLRPNAAAANGARIGSWIEARDLGAIARICADDIQIVHHPFGLAYGYREGIERFRLLFQATHLSVQDEPLATLGDALVLSRNFTSFSGLNDGELRFGASRSSYLNLAEFNDRQQLTRIEIFAEDHLSDAIVRLYERYAERLPEGPARTRAAAAARSLAALSGPIDPDRLAPAMIPSCEIFDHRHLGTWSVRGAEGILAHFRQQIDLAPNFALRDDDVLALEPNTLLVRRAYFGTSRDSGGAFENMLLDLLVVGPDGLLASSEVWEPDREAEALARFDEVTHGPAPRPVRRRVRTNAAAENSARLAAALAASDMDAAERLLADSVQVVHHPTGSTYGRAGVVETFRGLFRAKGIVVRHEPLATLGESLTLSRQLISYDSSEDEDMPVGAADFGVVLLEEVDAEGRRNRAEIFAIDHLGDAIARLYAHYAELLPDGPERQRAEVTARALVYTLTDSTTPDESLLFDPGYQDIDHRNVGYGKLSTEEAQKLVVTQRALADNLRFRIEDVLALRPDGLVRKTTTSGVWRDGGGAFERTVCMLSIFGADGRATRQETFDSDRAAEALARFDELTAPSAKATRRVAPNAVTSFWARFDEVFAARDADAIDACFSDSFAEIDHTTGGSYGRDGAIASIQRLLRAQDPGFRHEPLASLGPSLALVRGSISASGTGGGRFDVGAYEIEEIKVSEVDEQGRLCAAEVFGPDRIGDAVARLYERYAELLPEGPDRIRAVATARSVAAPLRHADLDALCATFASAIELIDHRTLGFGTLQGSEALREYFQALFETENFAVRIEDVLRLQSDMLLMRWTTAGTARMGGGEYDRQLLQLRIFGSDGLVTGIEYFDADRAAEALARFEELTGTPRYGAQERGSTSGHSEEGPIPGAPFSAPRQPIVPSSPRSGRIEGFDNAASRLNARMFRRWAARDWEGVLDTLSPALRMDDRRRLMRLEIGFEDFVAQFRMLFDQPRSRWHQPLLATRGERLTLHRTTFEAEVEGGGGPLVDDHVSLTEVDADGRCIAIVAFELDDIDAAYAELDARFEAGEAAAHAGASALRRAFGRFLEDRDWEGLTALCAPTLIAHDHRLAGWGTRRGPEAWLQALRTLAELAPDVHARIDHVRASDRGFVHEAVQCGTRDGGAFEIPVIAVLELDEQGKLIRLDLYDPGQLEQALGRFEELNAPAAEAETRFANAATRAVERGTAALAARDWEGFTALFAADFRHDDRTPMAQLESDGRQWLASFRQIVEMTTAPPTQQVLATRGDRLALIRVLWRGAEGDIGPSELEWILIVEVDDRGDHRAVVSFDADDLDAAYAELDARYEAGEAAHSGVSAWVRAFRRVFADRDWDALTALCAPALVAHDHRLAGWGTQRGPAAWVQALRSLVDLAPDVRTRVDHVRTSARVSLNEAVQWGTRDGGAFEIAATSVFELDEHGKLYRLDLYDPGQLEQARARFDEIAAPRYGAQERGSYSGQSEEGPVPGAHPSSPHQPIAPSSPRRGRIEGSSPRRGRIEGFANAATTMWEPVSASMIAHDWQAFAQLLAEDFRCSDRRRVVQLELDRDQYVAFTREVADGRTIRAHTEVLATRGERLALTRPTFEFADADVGPSEIAFLIITQMDERGRIVAYVRFDLEDLDAAYAELDARWEAGEAAAHPLASRWLADYQRGFAARDWSAMAAIMAPDLVSQSHRLVSWGTLHGPAGLVSTMRAQMDLAPDTQLRCDHVRTCARGLLMEYAWYGTRDGGAFENLLVAAVEIDALGRARRVDVWEAGQLEQAWARFQEIAALGSAVVEDPPARTSGQVAHAPCLDTAPKEGAYSGSPDGLRPRIDGDPLHIPPNASTRANDRWWACVEAGDWDGLRPLIEPIVFEDRRRLIRISGGADLLLADSRHLWETGLRPARTLLATAGDRLSLERMLWSVGEEGQRSELEVLKLCEVDREGRIAAYLIFDADDRATASSELFERYARSGADGTPSLAIEYIRAWNDRDLRRVRSLLPDDFVHHDHRHTGLGRIEGADAYVASIAALFELSPNVRLDQLYIVAMAPHGCVNVLRMHGTNTDGGEFESVFAGLALYRGEALAAVEIFELDDLDAAKARLEELRPDPLRIPPNAATRVREQLNRAFMSKDWDAMRALASDAFVFEDRRHWSLVSGGVELWIKSAETVQSATEELAFHDGVIAAVGDRIELRRRLVVGVGPDGAVFESEFIVLTEVDANGQLAASINFDLEERPAASAELFERWVASGDNDLPASFIEFVRAVNDHDLGRVRAVLADDFVVDDHRRLGLGHVEGANAYIASLAAGFEVSHGSRLDILCDVAVAPHGRVFVHRISGTNTEGGEFESLMIKLAHYPGGQIAAFEFFEPEDVEVAKARLEELRTAGTRG